MTTEHPITTIEPFNAVLAVDRAPHYWPAPTTVEGLLTILQSFRTELQHAYNRRAEQGLPWGDGAVVAAHSIRQLDEICNTTRQALDDLAQEEYDAWSAHGAPYGFLYSYQTGESIRPATRLEAEMSAHPSTGETGAISVEGTVCYVLGWPA
jgi:hypothetical protein